MGVLGALLGVLGVMLGISWAILEVSGWHFGGLCAPAGLKNERLAQARCYFFLKIADRAREPNIEQKSIKELFDFFTFFWHDRETTFSRFWDDFERKNLSKIEDLRLTFSTL